MVNTFVTVTPPYSALTVMLAESAVIAVNAIKPVMDIVGEVMPVLDTTVKLVAVAVTSTAPNRIFKFEVMPATEPIVTPSASQGTLALSFVR
jgi:hypothetical protein